MDQRTPPPADFRAEAVAASEELLAAWRRKSPAAAEADAVESGLSYCIRTDLDGPSIMRRHARFMRIGMVLTIGFLIAGIVALTVNSRAEKKGATDQEALSMAFVGCACAGFLACAFYCAKAHVRLLRRVAADRLAVERTGSSKPVILSLEDGQTFQKLKAAPEDIGAVLLHPASRCVQIEGVTHRYMIYADDVLGMEFARTPNSRAFVIQYAIGPRSLRIALFDSRLRTEFKLQIIGGRSRVFDQIQATLESENRSATGVTAAREAGA